ncbi:MAG: N-acetylmuramoyl-L-alanine amidase [Verrucomicrobiota bacterium]
MSRFLALFLFSLTAGLMAPELKASPFDTIVIDPGHGGKDNGALWGGVKEKELNLSVALRLKHLLESRGKRVVLTRSSDRFVSLEERCRIANRYHRSLFLSLHFNAAPRLGARGIETFYYGRRGRQLADQVHAHLLEGVDFYDRGIKRKRFHVLRGTRAPAVLVELGFLSNPVERKICAHPAYHDIVARQLALAVLRYR